MASGKCHSGWCERKRNYGYGRRLGYAALSALHDHYGSTDHYQTKHSHHARFANFVRWIKDHYGIRDARLITKAHMLSYGEHLLDSVQDGAYSVSYAQNLISTVNTVMRCLRHDRKLHVSPSKLVGRRTHTRQNTPHGERNEDVEQAAHALEQAQNPRAAAVLLLARAFGMRVREASLANLDRLLHEAKNRGKCRILEGTKGGRRCDDRCIPVEQDQWKALEYARTHSPKGSKNMLKPDETYRGFVCQVINPGRPIIQLHGLITYREMRAAFAVAIYEENAKQLAPVKRAPLDLIAHLRALDLVSIMLGHNRRHVSRAYVG